MRLGKKMNFTCLRKLKLLRLTRAFSEVTGTVKSWWRERPRPAKLPGGGSQSRWASCESCRGLLGSGFHASSPMLEWAFGDRAAVECHVPVSNPSKFTALPNGTLVVLSGCQFSVFCEWMFPVSPGRMAKQVAYGFGVLVVSFHQNRFYLFITK